jgi:hypothetical protein
VLKKYVHKKQRHKHTLFFIDATEDKLYTQDIIDIYEEIKKDRNEERINSKINSNIFSDVVPCILIMFHDVSGSSIASSG